MSGFRFPLAILLLYAWLFPWLPALRSPNELSRLYQARAIVDDHALSLNDQIARHGPVGDLSWRAGRYYPNKAPGVSFLGAPVYAALRAARGGAERVEEAEALFWLRLVLCVAPGTVAAELLRRVLARRFDPDLATSGAAVFALGTIAWPYSTLLMSHGPTAAALIACWWSIERRSWAMAGLAAGGSVLLEYTSAIALVPLAVHALRTQGARRTALLLAGAGALGPILALAAYHQAAFGSPFHTGYDHLVNPTFAQWHARGFMGVGAPSARALLGSFFDPARGLFAWAPFLALSVPGLALLHRRDRALALLCGAELAVYALFTASFTYEAWGWSVGPRHLTPLCAFLVPPALAAAEWLRDRRLGAIAAALALFSIGVVALTVAVCPYLPEELTNPVHQLVVPLARGGLRSRDLPELALGIESGWTLLPFAALLAIVAAWAAARLATAGGLRASATALLASTAAAIGLFAAQAALGGPDRFARTRSFMEEAFRAKPPAGGPTLPRTGR